MWMPNYSSPALHYALNSSIVTVIKQHCRSHSVPKPFHFGRCSPPVPSMWIEAGSKSAMLGASCGRTHDQIGKNPQNEIDCFCLFSTRGRCCHRRAFMYQSTDGWLLISQPLAISHITDVYPGNPWSNGGSGHSRHPRKRLLYSRNLNPTQSSMDVSLHLLEHAGTTGYDGYEPNTQGQKLDVHHTVRHKGPYDGDFF